MKLLSLGVAGFVVFACSSSHGMGFLEPCTGDIDCVLPMRCLATSACNGATPSLRCSSSCTNDNDCASLSTIKRPDWVSPPITCADHCDGTRACGATIRF